MFVWNEYLNGNGTLKKWGLKSKVRELKAKRKIQNEVIKINGVSAELKQILTLQIQIQKLKNKQWETKDYSNQIEIDLKEAELAELIRQSQKTEPLAYIKSVNEIQRVLQIRLDYKTLTIFDYFSLINSAKEWQRVNPSSPMR